MIDQYEIYLLDPQSSAYASAEQLNRLAQKYAKQLAPNNPDMLFQGACKSLHNTLRTQKPEWLKDLGLLTPAIQIFDFPHGFSRAYEKYPDLYCSQYSLAEGTDDKPNIYVFSPVDYKGNHFPPKDAQRLEESKLEEARALLFKDGAMSFLFISEAVGIKTPEDYPHKTVVTNDALHAWLDLDAEDRLMGNTPPPMPQEYVTFCSAEAIRDTASLEQGLQRPPTLNS